METKLPLVAAASAVVCLVSFFLIAAILKLTVLRTLRQASILEISNKLISLVVAVQFGYFGFLCVWNTRHDVIRAKYYMTNWSLSMLFGYILYDLWCMYYVFYLQMESLRGDVPSGFLRRLWIFGRTRWDMVGHHVLCLILSLSTVLSFRSGNGDFFTGGTGVLDLSTPFVCIHGILTELRANRGRLFMVNGVAMVVVFFTCRVAFIFPFMVYLCSRHANISLFEVPFYMPKKCLLVSTYFFMVQLYWLSRMMKGIRKFFLKQR